MAHTRSWLPETNKYKHDLALSPRKITLVSWHIVKQLGAKYGHPHRTYLQHSDTNMQIGSAGKWRMPDVNEQSLTTEVEISGV